MKSIKIVIFFFVLLTSISGFPKDSYSLPDVKNLNFKTGDIIAISENTVDPGTIFFEAATGTRYGHVGMVGVVDGKTYVFEGNPPYAQRTEINSYLARSMATDGKLQFTTVRPKTSLTSKQETELVKNMTDLVAKKVPYNYSMSMNSKAMNCSEFVYNLLNQSGIKGIGQIESMSQQNVNAFGGKLLELYNATGTPYDANAKVVTPASLVQSSQVETVYSSLPHDRILSDKELFEIWKKEGTLDGFSRMFGVPSSNLEQLGKLASDTPFKKIGQTLPPATTVTGGSTRTVDSPDQAVAQKTDIPAAVQTVTQQIKTQTNKPDFYQIEINGTKVLINQGLIDELAKSKDIRIDFVNNWDEDDTSNMSPRVKDPALAQSVYRRDIEEFFRSASVNKFKIKSFRVDGKEFFPNDFLSELAVINKEIKENPPKGTTPMTEADVLKVATEAKWDKVEFKRLMNDRGFKGGSLAMALAVFTAYQAIMKDRNANAEGDINKTQKSSERSPSGVTQ